MFHELPSYWGLLVTPSSLPLPPWTQGQNHKWQKKLPSQSEVLLIHTVLSFAWCPKSCIILVSLRGRGREGREMGNDYREDDLIPLLMLTFPGQLLMSSGTRYYSVCWKISKNITPQKKGPNSNSLRNSDKHDYRHCWATTMHRTESWWTSHTTYKYW